MGARVPRAVLAVVAAIAIAASSSKSNHAPSHGGSSPAKIAPSKKR